MMPATAAAMVTANICHRDFAATSIFSAIVMTCAVFAIFTAARSGIISALWARLIFWAVFIVKINVVHIQVSHQPNAEETGRAEDIRQPWPAPAPAARSTARTPSPSGAGGRRLPLWGGSPSLNSSSRIGVLHKLEARLCFCLRPFQPDRFGSIQPDARLRDVSRPEKRSRKRAAQFSVRAKVVKMVLRFWLHSPPGQAMRASSGGWLTFSKRVVSFR